MRHLRPQPKDTELTTQRIEAFSDGVFAIAITLLILEIHVPHLGEAGAPLSLADGLRQIWPSYLAYILSFVMIGIYWANHHYIYRIYVSTDHVFNLLNVFFLMAISFLPFPTALLGQHILDPVEQRTAATFYALGMLLPSVTWLLTWLYGSYRYRLIDTRLDPSFVQFLTRQYVVSVLLFSLTIVLAYLNPLLGIAFCIGLTLLYMLPPKSPVYRALEAPSIPGPD